MNTSSYNSILALSLLWMLQDVTAFQTPNSNRMPARSYTHTATTDAYGYGYGYNKAGMRRMVQDTCMRAVLPDSSSASKDGMVVTNDGGEDDSIGDNCNDMNSDEMMDEFDRLRMEIEQLKAEALERVNVLASRVNEIEVVEDDGSKGMVKDDEMLFKSTSDSIPVPKMEEEQLVPRQNMVSSSRMSTSSNSKPISSARDEQDLLVNTDWRILLNVGREPGTWMPKTWGVSGERLLINFEAVFTDDQLYEREDFLGSVGNARVLKVLNNEITLGPSVTEGSHTYKVKGGGWRVAKGQGPNGTDLLRFYIEIDSEVRHKGGDVYCPPGRIYATCGYFPMNHPRSWEKATLENQLEEIHAKYENIQDEMQKEGPFSLKRLALYRKLVQLSIDVENVNAKLYDAKVRDPDMSLLHLSKDRRVGLTREGGICCKVQKGPVGYEYHILGRFNINSSDLHM